MDSDIIQKLDTFFSQYPQQECKKGNAIIQAGTQPSGIFYIESGVIRSYCISPQGNEITQNMYKPHAFLPMSWAIANVENNSFYEALTDVVVKRAPKEEVLAFLKEEPDVLFDLLRRVYIGIEGLWKHFESASTRNSTSKLITSLIILAKRFGEKNKDSIVIELKMSEQTIANYAGLARETTSRELQKLKKENLVDFQKGILTLKSLHKLESKLLQ